MKINTLFISLIILLMLSNSASAQFLSQKIFGKSERQLVREGNECYDDKKFNSAEAHYKESLEKNEKKDLAASIFNLGNSYFQQGNYEEALKQYEEYKTMAKTSEEKAAAYHNIGNSHLKGSFKEENKVDKKGLLASVDAYKQALRNNPKDIDTKYNLAYALEILRQEQEENDKQCNNPKPSEDGEKKEQKDQKKQEQDQQKQQEEQQKKEQEEKEKSEEEKQEEEQKQQEKSEEEKKKEEEQKKGEKGEEQDKPPQDQAKPQPVPESRQMTKEEAARLLEALKNEESKVQQKVRGRKSKGTRIKIEKDW